MYSPRLKASHVRGGAAQGISRRDFVGIGTAALFAGAARPTERTQAEGVVAANAVKSFGRFQQLPGGSISPTGWLERYARINADGWVLKYAHDRPPAVWGRYIHRNEKGPADYGAYFGDALVRYAGLFPGTEVATAAQDWAERLIQSQDPDGYIGAFEVKGRWQDWFEVFSQSLLMDALIFRYECTGDATALAAAERSAALMMNNWYKPPEHYKVDSFTYIGGEIVRTMGKLYMATGNDSYPKFGLAVLQRFGLQKDYLGGGDKVVHRHAVGQAQQIGFPAAVYEYTGRPELLQASEAGWEMLKPYACVDGTPQGDEAIEHTGSRANCEHCGAVEWIITNHELSRITGEVKYADAVERAMFNGYPAPVSPDGQLVGYMHAPNELVATEWSQLDESINSDQDYFFSRQYYSDAGWPLCCNANGPRGIPHFIESMILRPENGLVVACYGPCQTVTKLPEAGSVTLRLETAYPFEDEIRMSIEPDRLVSFPLQLRIPAWCGSATIKINGTSFAGAVKPATYATIERVWNRGDKVTIRFVNPIRVTWGAEPLFGTRARCATISRGPIVFSLPVNPDWQQFKPPAEGPGQNAKAYRLLPKSDAVWNYALILDDAHPELSLTLKELPVPSIGRPWDSSPPLGLEAKARQVLNWRMEGDPDHPRTPGFPFMPMRLSHKVETVTLVPYGATRLRMTFRPIIPA